MNVCRNRYLSPAVGPQTGPLFTEGWLVVTQGWGTGLWKGVLGLPPRLLFVIPQGCVTAWSQEESSKFGAIHPGGGWLPVGDMSKTRAAVLMRMVMTFPSARARAACARWGRSAPM